MWQWGGMRDTCEKVSLILLMLRQNSDWRKNYTNHFHRYILTKCRKLRHWGRVHRQRTAQKNAADAWHAPHKSSKRIETTFWLKQTEGQAESQGSELSWSMLNDGRIPHHSIVQKLQCSFPRRLKLILDRAKTTQICWKNLADVMWLSIWGNFKMGKKAAKSKIGSAQNVHSLPKLKTKGTLQCGKGSKIAETKVWDAE